MSTDFKRVRKYAFTLLGLIAFFPIVYLILHNGNKTKVESPIKQPSIDWITKFKNDSSIENGIQLSLFYINSGDYFQADALIRKLLLRDSTNAILYNNLGTINISLKRYDLGIEACKKAIQLDSSFQLAKNNLNWGLDEKKKCQAEIDRLEKLGNDERNENYYVQLGLNYDNLNEISKVYSVLTTGLKKYPNNLQLINNFGINYMKFKKYDLAIKQFNKVLKEIPDDQLAKNNLQWALDEKNNKK